MDSDNPRARTGRHRRADVLAAAVDLLDRFGLADLTMRRLATSLQIQPSALYWHFESKQALLAAVSDWITRDRPERAQVLAGFGFAANDAPDQARWGDLLRAEAVWLRQALLAHRDGAEVVASTLALGLGDAVPTRHLHEAVVAAGCDDDTAAAAAQAVLHFILGSVQHEQQRNQAEQLGVSVPAAPAIHHAFAGQAEVAAGQLPGDFALGVDLFVDGIAARVGAGRTA